MDEQIKAVRSKLRLAMNGVTSASMREKGIHYKLNFGVAFPEIKKIALSFEQDAALAEKLWQEDVREMKILALLLYPSGEFSPERAEQWAGEIKYQEIAELYSRLLLSQLSYARELATAWIARKDLYFPMIGFLVYARLFTCEERFSESAETAFLEQARKALETENAFLQRCALLALKRFGRRRKEDAANVLRLLDDYSSCGDPVKEEFYHDLAFEFEYYL